MGQATLNLTNTVVTGNSAQGGGGDFGAGGGGGIAVFQNGRATLSGVTLAANRAIGGTSADGTVRVGRRGRSTGRRAGFRVEHARLRIPGHVIRGRSATASFTANAAIGGAGNSAGNGVGGCH